MKTLILMPVGTSLIENRGGINPRALAVELNSAVEAAVHSIETGTTADQVDRRQVLEKLRPLITGDELEKESRLRQSQGNKTKERIPQELSYLFHLQSADAALAQNAQVALLASDTEKGWFCARVIAEIVMLTTSPWEQFKLFQDSVGHRIEGLRVDSRNGDTTPIQEVFEQTGVPNLLEKCLELTRSAKSAAREDGLRVILNLTGGFKGSIPYTALAGYFLEADEVEVHYLFENSDAILRLPLYPIGLDFPLWRRQGRLLGLARDRPGSVYDSALDPRMKKVKDGSKGLPGILHEAYQRQRGTSPLQHQAEEVVRVLGFTKKDLRESALKLVQLGDRIWLGDKLPMAADHASKHHTDLLEIALCLLLPLLDAKGASGKEVLNEAERYVLLGAVLLHDSGHTLDRLPLTGNGPFAGLPQLGSLNAAPPTVPLFRSEIRELHHFLAYHRICGPESDLPADLFASPALRQAIATLGVYHRKRTGWNNREPAPGKGRCPFWHVQLEPPTAVDLSGQQIGFGKLVALLRLIDGCDNQLGRAGDSADEQSFLKLLERDRETWIVRLRELVSCLNAAWPDEQAARPLLGALSEAEWNCALGLKNEISAWLEAEDEKSELPRLGDYSASSGIWEVRRKLGEAVATGKSSCAAQAWLEVVRALDEIALRDRQEIHFVKHRCVEEIEVLTHDGAGKSAWSVAVCLHEPRDADLLTKLDCRDWFSEHKADAGTDKDTLRDWIQDEIVAELGPLPSEGEQGPIQCLRGALGGHFDVVFRWVDSSGIKKEPFFPQAAPGAASPS